MMTLEEIDKIVRLLSTPRRDDWLVMTSVGWVRHRRSMARLALTTCCGDPRTAMARAECNPWRFAFEPGQPVDLPGRRMNRHDRDDPLVKFILDKCELTGNVSSHDLFTAWKSWCEPRYHGVGILSEFKKRLVSTGRIEFVRGTYTGISLNSN